MKRIQFLFTLIPALMLSFIAAAEPVSKIETREAALKFFGMTKASSDIREVNSGADRSFTVYNREGGGWVIISNEDAVSPVLAYSHTGSFNFDEMSDGLGWWLPRPLPIPELEPDPEILVLSFNSIDNCIDSPIFFFNSLSGISSIGISEF